MEDGAMLDMLLMARNGCCNLQTAYHKAAPQSQTSPDWSDGPVMADSTNTSYYSVRFS